MADERLTPGLASLEAPLAIRVRAREGQILEAAVSTDRPLTAARALEGRPAASALSELPVLFRLCGTAQSVAGLRAIESAFDCPPGPGGHAARALLVAAEALEQALWRILLDWPRCTGGKADPGALKAFRARIAALGRAVYPDRAWIRPGGAALEADASQPVEDATALAEEIDTVVFGGACGSDVVAGRAAFEDWLRRAPCPTAAALDWVRAGGLADFGGDGIRPATDSDAEDVARRLSEQSDPGDLHAPGECVPQTGALARCADAPLVRELHADHGYGLLTQLGARLVEVVSLVSELRRQAAALAPERANGETRLGTGAGLGWVDTARGRLFHWAAVRDGEIIRYRTFAPTEWNFHARGPLARGLVGAAAGDAATLRRAVDLLVTAIDPCVGIALDVAEA